MHPCTMLSTAAAGYFQQQQAIEIYFNMACTRTTLGVVLVAMLVLLACPPARALRGLQGTCFSDTKKTYMEVCKGELGRDLDCQTNCDKNNQDPGDVATCVRACKDEYGRLGNSCEASATKCAKLICDQIGCCQWFQLCDKR